MSEALRRRPVRLAAADRIQEPVTGRVVGLDPDGVALVDFPGNTAGPSRARTVVRLPRSVLETSPGPEVMLGFEGGDPSKPVVLGLLQGTIVEPAPPVTALLDGQRVELTAEREIVLRCGQSSITLTAEGRIVVKGVELVSRAAASNKIRGASVEIN